MEEFDFLLEDRIAKIKAINEEYDLINNSYIAFSGGKDSTILHYLIDLALPNNNIPITTSWEDWFIEKFNIKLCDLYYPPFNFERTGCKGCPFSLQLKRNLEMLKEKLPNEYKQCNLIWHKVYDEYKRLGYRLNKEM